MNISHIVLIYLFISCFFHRLKRIFAKTVLKSEETHSKEDYGF